MVLLPADTTSATWFQVRRYAQERIAELTQDCIAISATDDQRREAACRIDELRTLLDAPAATRRVAENAATTPRETY